MLVKEERGAEFEAIDTMDHAEEEAKAGLVVDLEPSAIRALPERY